MHHLMGEHEGAGGWGFVRGGMGAISQAIARSGARFGLEVRTDAEIAKVLIEEGRATGVVTSAGDELRARAVACNANAKILFFDLVDAAPSAGGFSRRARPLPDLLDRVQDQRRLRAPAAVQGVRRRKVRLRLSEPTSTSARTSSISSGPTTTPSTAGTRPGRSSRRSCRPPSTTPSRRPASTSSTCSAATRRIALKNATWEHERANFVAQRARRDRRLRARLLRRHHRHAGPAAAGHRGDPEPARRATSSTASCRSTSCS